MTESSRPLNFLLVTLGSAGDVHPFVGLGKMLRDRGHAVTLFANGYFESLVRKAGLEFVELGTAQEYLDSTTNPDLWHPLRGFATVAKLGILPAMRPTYEQIEQRAVPGTTVVVATLIAFGARIAREKLGVPLATVSLAPAVFRSLIDPPAWPGGLMRPWLPKAVKSWLYRTADRYLLDPVLDAETNGFLRELKLPTVSRFVDRWWHSPDCTLGLFPDWFGSPQIDWPEQTWLTGFPLFDEADEVGMPDEVERFLDGELPPIVFTPGSAMRQGQQFFRAAVEACQRLDRPGILLSRFPEQMPNPLPARVRHFDYLPFSRILPRSAALVHHGGIGTTAQALAAGIPQLIMPMSHDQPDNAARCVRLGVAQALSPKQFRGYKVERALADLIESPAVAERARSLAESFSPRRDLEATCLVLEGLAGKPSSSNAEVARR